MILEDRAVLGRELLGVPGTDSDREALKTFLGEFPPRFTETCLGWLESNADGTWVVMPQSELAEFRMNPADCLARTSTTMRFLWKALPSPGRVVWCLTNSATRGLDAFEAEAVFAPWLAIELLHQVNPGAAESRIVLAGTLRTEWIGLAFHLSIPEGGIGQRVVASLKELASADVPAAVMFVEHGDAAYLAGHPNDPVTVALRGLLTTERVGLGLWVPPDRTGPALRDFNAEVAPLRVLAGGASGVGVVGFADPGGLATTTCLAEVLDRAQVAYDASLVAGRNDENAAELSRQGPYLRAGAFQPQAFDIRVPASRWDPNRWVELIRVPLADQKGGALNCSSRSSERDWIEAWQALWEWRQACDPERLGCLLDFRRTAAYFRLMAQSPALARHFHEYRVFNWPSPDIPARTTLLDCGTLDDPEVLLPFLRAARAFANDAGTRWRLAGPGAFLAEARREAERRSDHRGTDLLHQQVADHGYLKAIHPGAPLRADVAAFAAFLPKTLGSALELGSGNGQLARVLSDRADLYVCIDLVPAVTTAGTPLWEILADMHALPCKSGAFDTVVANNILEHSYDPLLCLSQVRRVLRPGGRLLALMPLDALNSAQQCRAHLWKPDLAGVGAALAASGLVLRRLCVIDQHALGVEGAFPSSNGLQCAVEAEKLDGDIPIPLRIAAMHSDRSSRDQTIESLRLEVDVQREIVAELSGVQKALVEMQRQVNLRDEMLARLEGTLQSEVRRRDEVIEQTQREVNLRDEMLARLQAALETEARRRDEIIQAVQREVNVRDQMLADLQAAFAREVGLRDRLLEGLQQQVNRLNTPLESPAPMGGAESPDPSAPISPARDERGA